MKKDINRRDFLKLSGTVAATTALASCGMKGEGGDLKKEEEALQKLFRK